MSTDAKDQGPVVVKRKRRRISDLERMAKKVNEMRIANNDERLVIVNTICNVESNDALSKFMSIDGHVLLASWLNQALSQSHTALQMALLKLAARLPISGNMSTAIEATVSELALKCSVAEIRDLARTALSEWQNEKPNPRHFSITIGDSSRKVVFERDPEYASSGDDQPNSKKRRPGRKSLQWAPEHRLEMVRLFQYHPDEKQPASSSSSSSTKTATPQILPQTSWSCPPSLLLPDSCIFRERASQSVEVKAQASRTAGLMEVVYFKKDQIPPNPASPPSQPSSNEPPYCADFRNLPPPSGGMQSTNSSNPIFSLESHENAAALEEMMSLDPASIVDLYEASDPNLESEEDRQFGFVRTRSPPPSVRRERPRSPPLIDSPFDNFGLPLPPSPPRAGFRYPPGQRPYVPPPEHLPFDNYGRPVFRDPSPYHYELEHQRRRSPPRPMPPYGPRSGSYAEFNGPAPPQGRYDNFRGYPDHRLPGRFPERPSDYRDRPPSPPFRGEMYPQRPQDERRSGRLCKFHQMPRGCTLGDSCSFLHENPTRVNSPPGPVKRQTGSQRSRQRARNKGRGPAPPPPPPAAAAAATSASEPPKPVELPAVAENAGEFDQFGRLRKVATSAAELPPGQ